MVAKILLHQRWTDIGKYYGSMKKNIAVLYERGFSFRKIIMFSQVENIFLCAIFFMLGKHDKTAEGIVSSFSSDEKIKYDKFVNIFRMIEAEDYSKKLKGEEEAVELESEMLQERKLDQEKEEKEKEKEKEKKQKTRGQAAQKSSFSSEGPGQGAARSSRKRVHFAGAEEDEYGEGVDDDGEIKDSDKTEDQETATDRDADEREPKRLRLDPLHYSEEISDLVSELRTSINDYTLLLLEQDQQQSQVGSTGISSTGIAREHITAELSSALRRLRQYDEATVKQELGRGAAPALRVRLYGDLERFRFKRYEIQSRLQRIEEKDSVDKVVDDFDEKDDSADTSTSTALELQLAQRIDAVRAVLAASLDSPDGQGAVSRDTLDRAVTAGAFISRRCEQHLTAVLARATELCVAAADATRAARERLLQLEEERGENGPEQEVGGEMSRVWAEDRAEEEGDCVLLGKGTEQLEEEGAD